VKTTDSMEAGLLLMVLNAAGMSQCEVHPITPFRQVKPQIHILNSSSLEGLYTCWENKAQTIMHKTS